MKGPMLGAVQDKVSDVNLNLNFITDANTSNMESNGLYIGTKYCWHPGIALPLHSHSTFSMTDCTLKDRSRIEIKVGKKTRAQGFIASSSSSCSFDPEDRWERGKRGRRHTLVSLC